MLPCMIVHEDTSLLDVLNDFQQGQLSFHVEVCVSDHLSWYKTSLPDAHVQEFILES